MNRSIFTTALDHPSIETVDYEILIFRTWSSWKLVERMNGFEGGPVSPGKPARSRASLVGVK